MNWKDVAVNLRQSCKAGFDLTLSERRFLLGVLLLFGIGLGARWIHQRQSQPAPYTPPQELHP